MVSSLSLNSCLSSIQVELAHGGSRGPPPSDRRGGYGGGSSSRGGSSGGRFGVSRHSEFRGVSSTRMHYLIE